MKDVSHINAYGPLINVGHCVLLCQTFLKKDRFVDIIVDRRIKRWIVRYRMS